MPTNSEDEKIEGEAFIVVETMGRNKRKLKRNHLVPSYYIIYIIRLAQEPGKYVNETGEAVSIVTEQFVENCPSVGNQRDSPKRRALCEFYLNAERLGKMAVLGHALDWIPAKIQPKRLKNIYGESLTHSSSE